MNTQNENQFHELLRTASNAEGQTRLKHLNQAAALVEARTTNSIIDELTDDEESKIRKLQDAMNFPEVRNNGKSLANLARAIRLIRFGSR